MYCGLAWQMAARILCCLQAEGELFMPFEQRMTRDIKATRARRHARRKTASGKLELVENMDASLLQHGPASSVQVCYIFTPLSRPLCSDA